MQKLILVAWLAAGHVARLALVLQRGSAKSARAGHRRQLSRADRRPERVPEIDRLFHSLGTFEPPAGHGPSVVVETADTDGYVVVDALQVLER